MLGVVVVFINSVDDLVAVVVGVGVDLVGDTGRVRVREESVLLGVHLVFWGDSLREIKRPLFSLLDMALFEGIGGDGRRGGGCFTS